MSWGWITIGFLLVGVIGPGESPVVLPVTRDTWFSNVGAEADGNNGGAPQLKVKSYQEMSLIDVDPSVMRGRVVIGATLHLKLSGESVLRRVTVGSFGAPWVEGSGRSYEGQAGSSTFNRRKHPDAAWTPDGGDLCRVILGEGGTLWKMADATAPDGGRWQTIAVDPGVVGARIAGLSEGFFVFDDTGSEWTREGEKFTTQHMPNRFFYSREGGKVNAPYLSVILGAADHAAPGLPEGIRFDVEGLPAGEAKVSWTTPRDEGVAGTAGFFVEAGGREVPRSYLPRTGQVGERVVMHLRDLGFKPGVEVVVRIRGVDNAGNLGKTAEGKGRVSSKVAAKLPMAKIEGFAGGQGELPLLSGGRVGIIDELDKVGARDGGIMGAPEGYKAGNHLWSAREKRVRLQAARNEFIAFQVAIRGGMREVKPTLTFGGAIGSKVKVEFGRYHLVNTKAGPLADPIVRLGGVEDTAWVGEKIENQSLHVEIYVAHDAPAGEHKGTLVLEAGRERLSIGVSLRVWDFTLPDDLSFLPEMNCYGLPENERDFYRLAQRHRTVLNRVPYSQNGSVAEGFAPRLIGKTFDWTEWDRRFGPLLDGSAFADLPRRGVPIEVFYLPLHENWPTVIEGNYNGDYWADRAFTAGYRGAFVEASRQFSAHLDGKGWSKTFFQCFFNGKLDFKRAGWSRGSSPWLLDEPGNFQDFWALRYFGEAFHEGVKKAAPRHAKMAFRADVSRPQWQRDSLDGLLDYNVVGGAMRSYSRIVLDRKEAQKQVVVEYGSANPLEESNMQAVGWCLDAWSLGVDGVLPWQTVGRGESWMEGDTLALFYPGRRGKEPVPSVRLKAFRRGQQDVEYLTLLAKTTGEPRWGVGQRVREELGLSGKRGGSGSGGGEDAGLVRYDGLRAQDAWSLRVRVGQALSDRHPAPERQVVELRTPARDVSRLEQHLLQSAPTSGR